MREAKSYWTSAAPSENSWDVSAVSAVQPLGKLSTFYPRLRFLRTLTIQLLYKSEYYLLFSITYNMLERQYSQLEKTWKEENFKNLTL